MDSIGMVLAGGGGKGAYEVGVWLALQDMINELGLKIDAFAGASVGALNAALFACNSPQEIDDIWAEVTPKRILANKSVEDYLEMVTDFCVNANMSKKIITYGSMGFARLIAPFTSLLIQSLSNGLFSRSGLERLIEKAGIEQKIDKKHVFASYLPRKLSGLIKYGTLNKSNCKDLLLASSAIPFAFSPHYIDGERCIDGGWFWGGDNLPIKPLVNPTDKRRKKYKKLIVIHLSRDDKDYMKDLDLQGCKIYHIFPEIGLGEVFKTGRIGELLGTLNFTQEAVQRKKNQGISEIKKEYVFLDEIRDLFEDDNPNELHLYKGEFYDSVDELYDQLSKKVPSSSYEKKMQKINSQLETMLNEYLVENLVANQEDWNNLKNAQALGDADWFIESVNRINERFGGTPSFSSTEECINMILNGETIKI